MIELIERGNIKDPAVVRALEYIIARLRGLLSQTFDQDGNLIPGTTPSGLTPIGSILPFAGSIAPPGWLLADGQAVSRATYKALFQVIGATYGAGNGTTSFNVPDLRGRFLLSKAVSGTGAVLGETGGALDVSVGAHTHTTPAHQHAIGADGGHNHGGATGAVGAHSHSVSVSISGSTGGSTANADFDTNFDGSFSTAARDTHTHTVSGSGSGSTSEENNHAHTIGAVGDHNHGGATASDGSGTTGSSGGGAPSNPAYMAVNHIVFSGV